MPTICLVCCARDPKGAFSFHDFSISRWSFGGLVEAATTVFWGNADILWGNWGNHGLCVVRNWQVMGRHQILPSLLNFLHRVCKQSFHPLFQNCLRNMKSWRYTLISNVWGMNTDMYILFFKQVSNCIVTFLLTIGTLDFPYLHCFLSVHPKSPNPNLSVGSWRWWWMSGSQRRRFVRGGGTPIGLGHQWTTGIAAHH